MPRRWATGVRCVLRKCLMQNGSGEIVGVNGCKRPPSTLPRGNNIEPTQSTDNRIAHVLRIQRNDDTGLAMGLSMGLEKEGRGGGVRPGLLRAPPSPHPDARASQFWADIRPQKLVHNPAQKRRAKCRQREPIPTHIWGSNSAPTVGAGNYNPCTDFALVPIQNNT